jgi:hypothetical protein
LVSFCSLSYNEEDLERIQKSAVRIILDKDIKYYSDALAEANLDSLKERRELCYEYAKKCIRRENSKEMLPIREQAQIKQELQILVNKIWDRIWDKNLG